MISWLCGTDLPSTDSGAEHLFITIKWKLGLLHNRCGCKVEGNGVKRDRSAGRDLWVSMEPGPAALWTCLLGAGLALVLPPAMSTTTSKAFPRPPRLIGCVFINRANVTCRWEAGDSPATNYTLQVQRKPGTDPITTSSSLKTFTCSTSETSCTAGLSGSSVRFTFCVTITAQTRGQTISSPPRCQPGRTEVMLPAVILNSVKPLNGTPQCLNVIWSRTLSVFPASTSDIKAGNLNSQIEFKAQGQLYVQVKNVTVKDYSFPVCLFRPDTLYTIKLRHRYQGPDSPWSLWSNALQGRTGEDAPSVAPVLWRQVKKTDTNGWRFVSLLWKLLPRFLANGKVLYYSVTCQTESTQILNDYGNCRDLNHTRTSCSLLLPPEPCSCTLTASNSAGTSPEAQIWLLGASETEPPSLSQITTTVLDQNNLDVRWTAPVDHSVSGFVVEWFAVREKTSSTIYWERLNSSCTALVIRDGIKPLERYAVSVKVLYGERGAGENRTRYIYTVQGVPSAGPVVAVQQISGSRVELGWIPVAVELLHGFIRNYTLYYTATNQSTRSVFVPGHVHRYSLKKLSPGNYEIFMRANTDAGAGAAGPICNVHIGSEEISLAMYTILPLMMMTLALILTACLAQTDIVKLRLCRDLPDPSHSSLAYWTPKTTLESMKHPVYLQEPEVQYSQVSILGESEPQNSDLDEDIGSHVCNFKTYSTCQHSPLSLSDSNTLQNTQITEKLIRCLTKAKTNSHVDLSSSVYSKVIVCQTLENPPTPNPSSSCCHTVRPEDVKLQLDREKDTHEGKTTTRLDASPSPADEMKTFGLFLKQQQIPVSFSDKGSVSQPTILQTHLAEVSSATHHSTPQSNFNTFTYPNASPDNFKFVTFLPPVLGDFTFSSVDYDSYISAAI
ncbi:interleukin-31 receptor subunit alpha [Channa argus]|uniref:interleukin-31 receptor subunit alpha n=1 Tax=Channa argus TaxID=215402 RepID=UPI00351F81D4